jgi:hypothetical protein
MIRVNEEGTTITVSSKSAEIPLGPTSALDVGSQLMTFARKFSNSSEFFDQKASRSKRGWARLWGKWDRRGQDNPHDPTHGRYRARVFPQEYPGAGNQIHVWVDGMWVPGMVSMERTLCGTGYVAVLWHSYEYGTRRLVSSQYWMFSPPYPGVML